MDEFEGVPDTDVLDEVVTDAVEPYAGIDVSALPDWWRNAIEEFEAHDLRPYQPPRFSDGVLTFTVVDRLEAEFGVNIGFFGRNVTHGDGWEVRVDGEPIGPIDHRRTSDGYTVFEVEADIFANWITEHVRDRLESGPGA